MNSSDKDEDEELKNINAMLEEMDMNILAKDKAVKTIKKMIKEDDFSGVLCFFFKDEENTNSEITYCTGGNLIQALLNILRDIKNGIGQEKMEAIITDFYKNLKESDNNNSMII